MASCAKSCIACCVSEFGGDICCGDSCCLDGQFCCGDGLCCSSEDACGLEFIVSNFTTQSSCLATASSLGGSTLTFTESTSTSSSTTSISTLSSSTASLSLSSPTSSSPANGSGNSSSSSGLSGGAIAGIVVGIVGVMGILLVAAFLWRRRRRQGPPPPATPETYNPAGGRHELGATADEELDRTKNLAEADADHGLHEMNVLPPEAPAEVVFELPAESRPVEMSSVGNDKENVVRRRPTS